MLWRNGCQHRWRLDVLEKMGRQNYGLAMDFGTALHETIENYWNRSGNKPEGDPKDFFEGRFRKLLDQNTAKYREKEQEQLAKDGPNNLISSGYYILDKFNENEELASAEILYNEYKLMVPIDRDDGITVNFKGFIDMVIKTKDKRGNTILYVCDFKTCSWGWPIEKKNNKELHFQILLYKHFICKKFNLDPKGVRTAFVLLKKRPPKGTPPIEFFPISAGPVSVQRALDAINSDITEMADRTARMDFKKNRDFCVNDFGDVCPHKGTENCVD